MKDLIIAAKELNQVLDLEPPIEVNSKKTNEKTLEKKIKQAAELIEPEDDEISMPTQQILSKLGCNPWDTEEEQEEDGTPEELEDAEEVETDPESEEVEEVDEVVEEKETVCTSKKVEKKVGPKGKPMATKTESKTKGELSNKALVYLSWSKGQTDSAKLFTEIKEAVKETTVKSWIKSWEKGKNLPAIANK